MVLGLLMQCANPVTPEGGPRDTKPPVFLKAEPPQYTTNFDQDRIRVYFNEFILLKDVNSQLIISPPMQKNPDIKIKGKSVVIDLNEPLIENTTYSFFLGDAIVDLTENNPVSNFRYVLSTGDILDSLSIDGKVFDAFTNEPAEGVDVMLYLDNNDTIPIDSLPYLVKPYFISKTDKSGKFNLTNLPDREFKIFGLKDQNTNLIYDQPIEAIAFKDEMISPYYLPPKIIQDTTLKDSIQADTTNFLPPKKDPVELALFINKDTTQKLIKATLLKEAQVIFVFKNPAQDPEFNPLFPIADMGEILWEENKTKDTVTFWLNRPILDTLRYEVVENDVILDTVIIETKIEERGRRGKKEEEQVQAIKMKFNTKSGRLDLNRDLTINFDYPLQSWDTTGMFLIEEADTLVPELVFPDEIQKKAVVKHKWEPAKSYTLIIPDSAFFSIAGHSHDTITKNFTTGAIEDYGNLFIDIKVTEAGLNHIIQLIKEKSIIEEKNLTQDEQVSFTYLLPGSYSVKVIYDYNNNGKWDTGDYLKKIQPEEVNFFPSEITVRANWDIEELWEL
jgi:hypothetical protein